MNTYETNWNFSGCRVGDRTTIKARNLPEALEATAKEQGWKIDGQTLKTNGRRRIKFFGRAGGLCISGYIAKVVV